MKEKKWEDYIDEVLSFVKFKYDHNAIRLELVEHMEDLREDLMAEDMDEGAAEYLAVASKTEDITALAGKRKGFLLHLQKSIWGFSGG